ncbi:LuxR family transcriptional regulator [Neorhizobium galegae]|nr:LuxR family transcriptional regulator [Neorhizobium galegae]KAA9387876.1 LuxR family transcriptional regulator [Neorhizobium galegae]KAB1115652.1 LuxR family transcriptional regulator [Neorhizobium galegae]CDZ25249.1 HTH-type quorum sensing-dependent transcriptional regulator VjbR [Neorhizobium galegae bv. officinalis]
MITLERQSILNSEISAADSRVEIFAALKRVAHEFGFRHITLFAATRADETLLSRMIVETTLPASYVQEFDRRRLLKLCPVAPIVTKSVLPYCWSIDDPESVRGFPVPVEMDELQRRYDIIASVAMAVHSIDGGRFMLRFDGIRHRLSQVELNEIGMIVLHAFDVFDKIRRSAKTGTAGPLTTRELEVVRWTAQGKTSSEIGRILSLSDHTVNAYMTNAIKKLDCVNRTQLVAKALRLRLIV